MKWYYFCVGSAGHGNGKGKEKSTNAKLETQADIDDCKAYFAKCKSNSIGPGGGTGFVYGTTNVEGLAGSAPSTLEMLKTFFDRCKKDEAQPVVYYTGHGNEQGDWCFPDGAITFDDIMTASANGGKFPILLCDCCHSGEWVYKASNKRKNGSGPHVVAAAGGSQQDKKLAYNRVFADAVFNKKAEAKEKLYSNSRAISTKRCGGDDGEVVWFKGFESSFIEP